MSPEEVRHGDVTTGVKRVWNVITADKYSTLLDIVGLDILGLDILGLDILGLDILGLDILGMTPFFQS